MGDDTIYPVLLMAGVVCWNKFPGYWQLKDNKNSSLTINYLLKCNGVTIIYTIYMEIVTFVVIERQTIEVFGLCNLSILLNFSESETFAGETSFLRNFFSYSLVFSSDIESLLLFNPKNVYIYRGFLWEQTFLIGWPITDPFVFFYYFLLASQSNALIYICGKTILSTYQILIGHPITPQYRGFVN